MDGGVLVVFHSKVTFTTRPAFGTYNNGVEYNLVASGAGALIMDRAFELLTS
jgi:hypothetical protein